MSQATAARKRINQFEQDLIVEHATDLFYDNGYTGTSMDMIAAALGVTKKFLYARYKSKVDILTEILTRAELIALDALKHEMRASDRPDMKLYRVLRSYIDAALDHKKLIAVFLAEDRNLPRDKLGRVNAMIAEWQDGVVDILEQGKQQGVFHFAYADLTLHAIMGVVMWTYAWAQVSDPEERERVAAGLTQSALALAGCEVPDLG